MTMKTTDNIPFDDYAAAWQEESRRIRQLTEGVGTEGTASAIRRAWRHDLFLFCLRPFIPISVAVLLIFTVLPSPVKGAQAISSLKDCNLKIEYMQSILDSI